MECVENKDIKAISADYVIWGTTIISDEVFVKIATSELASQMQQHTAFFWSSSPSMIVLTMTKPFSKTILMVLT